MPPSNFQTSFIPKKPIVETVVKEKISFGLFDFIGLVLFLISAGMAVGVYFYNDNLSKDLSAKQSQLNNAKNTLESPLISQAKVLGRRITDANQILSNHIIVSPIFNALQLNTLKSIQFNNFSYSTPAGSKDKIAVEIGGIARDYTSIALESDQLAKIKEIQNPIFSGLSLDSATGNVSFSLNFTVDASLVNFASHVADYSALAPDYVDSNSTVLDVTTLNTSSSSRAIQIPNTSSSTAHTTDHYLLVDIVGKILPCCICRDNYKQNIKSIQQVYLNPAATQMRQSGLGLNRAFFDIHNIANAKTGNPAYDWAQFKSDMLFARRLFAVNFAQHVHLFCSFITSMHDTMENEVQTQNVLEFLRIICACLVSFKNEPDIGTLCYDMGSHGLTTLKSNMLKLPSGKVNTTLLIQQIFGPFVNPTSDNRPYPFIIPPIALNKSLYPTPSSQPYYDIYDQHTQLSQYVQPITTPRGEISHNLFKNIRSAVDVARVHGKRGVNDT